MSKLLFDVQARANKGHIYSKYLIADIEYSMYGRDRRNTSKEKEAAQIILSIAEQGNVSALAMKGFWGSKGHNNATSNKKEAISFFEKAAELKHPMAYAWLGSYYRSGECGLSLDKTKAESLLKIACAYDHPYGKKEYEKLNGGSTASSCFITTAVCNSFGREDDCYELTTFRKFRDEWLLETTKGQELITEYYLIAPNIVTCIDNQSDKECIYFSIWNNYLKQCLKAIEDKQYSLCAQLYTEMVYNLKSKYLNHN